ncbi:hypothetical protein DFH09DRAFT_1401989 [Mycena vulgaris]|nr:hypothetical protein DFH09DRAFT_1401989 [Mycena vulgaris]
MFHHCSNFTIAGGTFNVWEQRAAPRQVLSSDPQCVRSIHLGDLNLLTQVGSEETLNSELVEQVGRQDITVRREVIVASRTVYRARVFGSQNPMTAVVYRGAQLEKWRTEAEKRQNLLNPFFLQLFAVAESPGLNALIFHDELITISQFRDVLRGSLLASLYAEYQMKHWQARDLYFPAQDDTRLDLSTTQDLFRWDVLVAGTTRDVEQQLLARMDLGSVHRLLSFWGDYRWGIRPSFQSFVPLGHLLTSAGEDLDYQVRFSDREIDKINLHIQWDPAEGCQGFVSESTPVGNDWTRICVPAICGADLGLLSDIGLHYPSVRYINEGWLSQATEILGSTLASDILVLDELFLSCGATLSIRLHYTTKIPSLDDQWNMPYLFAFTPSMIFDVDGRCFIDVLRADQRFFWSFDPSGAEPLEDNLSAQMSLPQVFFDVELRGNSWTAAQYDLLGKFHRKKGHTC